MDSLRSMMVAAALAFAVGCAAPATELADGETASTEDALSAGSLRQRTALDRAVVLGATEGAVRVDYVPAATADYVGPAAALPFEAVHFDASPTSAVVEVAGDFPSSAMVVVTDDQFRVLSVARTTAAAEGVLQTRLRVPGGAGGRFVLVRDPLWSKPMAFDVRVTR